MVSVSIVIDGGGRLSISVPKEKADKAQKLMIRAYGETFINNSRKPVSFLNQEIDEAFYAHVSLEERNRAYQDDNPDSFDDLRKKFTVRILSSQASSIPMLSKR